MTILKPVSSEMLNTFCHNEKEAGGEELSLCQYGQAGVSLACEHRP